MAGSMQRTMEDLEELSDVVGLSSSLELRTVDGMDRGVFTKESISAGDTIFNALPLVHCSAEGAKGSLCEHCLKSSESLKKCTGCMFVKYCSNDCQKSDWLLHRKECKKLKGSMVTPFARLALRAQDINTQHLCSLPDGSLTEHLTKELITKTADLCKCSERVIYMLFLKLFCNSFSMMAAKDLDSMGMALYSAPSLLNHSCRPNTTYLFNGRKLVLKAVRDIGPNEQLFITYTDTLELWEERQYVLCEKYKFTCACERCSEDLTNSPGRSERLLLMGANGKKISEVLRYEMEKNLTELKGLNERGEWQEVYDKGRALNTSHLTQLSPDNSLRMRLMYELSGASMKLCLWEEALEYSIQILEPFINHYGLLNPRSVNQLVKIAELRQQLGTTDQLTLALGDLTKARDAAERLYGDDHLFTLEVAVMLHTLISEVLDRTHAANNQTS